MDVNISQEAANLFPQPESETVQNKVESVEVEDSQGHNILYPVMSQGPAVRLNVSETSSQYTNPNLHRRIDLTNQPDYEDNIVYYVGYNVVYEGSLYQAVKTVVQSDTEHHPPMIDGVVDELYWVKIYGSDDSGPVNIDLAIQDVYSYRTIETKIHNDSETFDEIEIP